MTTARTLSALLGWALFITACASATVDVQTWCAEVQDATRQFLDAEAGNGDLPDPNKMLDLFEHSPEAVRAAYESLDEQEGIDALTVMLIATTSSPRPGPRQGEPEGRPLTGL